MLWGIDLGGTKIEGVILESEENPEVQVRLRVPTEQAKGYKHILNQINPDYSLQNDKGSHAETERAVFDRFTVGLIPIQAKHVFPKIG